MIKTATSSSFPIPSSLQDLERAPYNLLPYPHDFEDDDEAARADSFDALVHLVEQGNRTLVSGSLSLFGEDGDEPWMDEDRIQALYTLVRLVPHHMLSRYCLRSSEQLIIFFRTSAESLLRLLRQPEPA